MYKQRQAFTSKLLLLLFSLSLIASPALADSPSASKSENFYVGMNPGIQMRMEQKTINAFKMAVGDLFPKMAKFKIGLPDHFHYKVGMFLDFLSYNINITDISYDDIELQMEKTSISFINAYDKQIVKVNFPAIKDW